MKLVVADTGPLNYLVQLGMVDVLARLVETVVLPESVHAEA